MKNIKAIRLARLASAAAFCACLLISLAACSSDDSKDSKDRDPPSKRVSVLLDTDKPKIDSSLSGFSVVLPGAALNRDWPSNGGNVGHAPGNPAMAAAPKEAWHASVGSGSSSDFKLLASPVVGPKAIYTMDSIGRVSAWSLEDGDRLWRVDTAPDKSDDDAMGGGVGYDNGVVYATTGFGEAFAIKAADGKIVWRHKLGKPIRSAPTVAEGRLYAISIENDTYALDARTGTLLWQQSGIAESASLMGASSAAVQGDTVVVAYSSGELFALRTQNGRVIWGDVLAVPTKKGALPAIADIRGLPVVDKGHVFAVSHSGRMVSMDARTGERLWDADIGGFNTPCLGENTVFVISNDDQLIALTRDKGQILWMTDLQKVENPNSKSSRRMVWSGPVLAGGKLWLTNSLGFLASYEPSSGKLLESKEVSDPLYLPPVIAQKTMFLLSDDGRLHALK